MKLLFVGVSPEPALEKLLLANQFEISHLKSLKTLPESAADLIAFRATEKENLAEIERLHVSFPSSWLVVVAKRSLLRESDFQNELLRTTAKHDVWVEEDWQITFWLALQRYFQTQGLRQEVSSLRQSYEELSSSSHRLIQQLEKDVGLAASIQRSLLPRVSPQIPGVSIAVKYLPAEGRGGDYYDIFEFGDRKRFGVLMADSKTHGMAAALLSVLLKVRLGEMKDRFPDAKSFMSFLNREIQQVYKKELSSISLLYGILDRSTLSFQFSAAGHLQPILWRAGSPLPIEHREAPPLGGIEQFDFQEETVQLKPGDLLILHTDGLEPALTQRHDNAFDGLVGLLREQVTSPHPQDVQNELMAIVDRYVEKTPLSDDLTVIHFAIDERALYVAQDG